MAERHPSGAPGPPRLRIDTADFVTSAASLRQAPEAPGVREIAVVGRSNVGKSSFLSSLTGRRNLARASQTPGRTTLLNFFLINSSWFLVDLPGYGYARRSHKERERLARMTQEYLSRREPLALVIQLIDARHGPQPSDLDSIRWLRGLDRDLLIVLTKSDKLSRAQLARSLQATAEALSLPREELRSYSSITGDGRPEVLRALAETLSPTQA